MILNLQKQLFYFLLLACLVFTSCKAQTCGNEFTPSKIKKKSGKRNKELFDKRERSRRKWG